MNFFTNNHPKETLNLFGLEDKLTFLINLYENNKLPKVLMFTGKKGIGKFTLTNHFLNYVFDKDNYNLKNCLINRISDFNKQYLKDIFQNIILVSGNDFKNPKIDDIRNLKKLVLKTTLLNQKRFVILDDIELFNKNCLNALLKILEEPPNNNYFILINNQSKSLIETVHSRSLKINISLTNKCRVDIINSIIKKKKLNVHIDYDLMHLTPGNFLLFNNICELIKFDFDEDFLTNLDNLFSLYKKNKDINLINFSLFYTDYYFRNIKEYENFNKVYENKFFVINNINKFITFNINQTSLLNAINNRLSNG